MPFLDTVTKTYERQARSVSAARKLLPSAQRIVTGIGLGRVLIGATFLAAPTLSVRMLGVDTATAKRMAFLARMTAARDIALGVGTLNAGTGRRAVPWLVAGAGADLVDAAAIAAALKSGLARGVPAGITVVGAAATGAAAMWAAGQLRNLD